MPLVHDLPSHQSFTPRRSAALTTTKSLLLIRCKRHRGWTGPLPSAQRLWQMPSRCPEPQPGAPSISSSKCSSDRHKCDAQSLPLLA